MKTNPFNAATTILRVKVASRGEGSERIELEAAIRFLEAAGKVDKEDKELAIHWMEDDYSTIRALLSALPEVKK